MSGATQRALSNSPAESKYFGVAWPTVHMQRRSVQKLVSKLQQGNVVCKVGVEVAVYKHIFLIQRSLCLGSPFGGAGTVTGPDAFR